MTDDELAEIVLDEAKDPYVATILLYLMNRANEQFKVSCYVDGQRLIFRHRGGSYCSKEIEVRLVDHYASCQYVPDHKLVIHTSNGETSITHEQLGNPEELERVWLTACRHLRSRGY